MKKLLLKAILFGACLHPAIAQQTRLTIAMKNCAATSCYILRASQALKYDHFKNGSVMLTLAGGNAVYTLASATPEFITFTATASNTDRKNRIFYYFYLSPGDDIRLDADFLKEGNGITVSGKGSNNNQPLSRPDFDREKFFGDTLPQRALAEIVRSQALYRQDLLKYVKTYNPTKDFITSMEQEITYYAPMSYISFKGNNKFKIRNAYERNLSQWEQVQGDLLKNAKLNNDASMLSPSYLRLLADFLGREKERLWAESSTNPEKFFKDWYDCSVSDGTLQFADDQTNLLQEKIINRYFTGRPAEYLYAVLLEDAVQESNPKNMLSIYDRFRSKYPSSHYLSWFEEPLSAIRKKLTNPLTPSMVFAAANGTNLNSLSEVLAMMKGKTVLLDMWGTWCGPCREELEKDGPQLKAYFKGKGLDYLYVANYDLHNEGEWKRLIAYFNLGGTHILANDQLNRDIMSRVKGSGYPTYVIIKKDGSYELSKAGYPMNRAAMIKQLDEALNSK